MVEKRKTHISSLGLKYSTLRDHPLHTGEIWLEGKRADDAAEGLWRINDNLYDLNIFSKIHPGGQDWIRLTKGTDITEAFETHHLKGVAEKALPKYFVRTANKPRNSPFTFYENGFYKTLKRRVVAELPKIPKASIERSKTIIDILVVSYIILALLAVYVKSFAIGLLAGLFLSLTAIAAHNFFHQKDNFRMYYFDFSLMQAKAWRISHVLSHHLYTNSINDLEVAQSEPLLEYLPIQKNFILNYLQWVYEPILFCFTFFGVFGVNVVQMIIYKSGYSHTIILPLSVLLAMILVSGGNILFSLSMYVWIKTIGSIHFGFVGLNAGGHHHPEIFHDGDAVRPQNEMDWGVYQLDTVMDRNELVGSHILGITHFGDHAIHHLFPTIDHGALNYLYPVLSKTCEEFGVDWKVSCLLELVKGQFLQLVKTEGTKKPPKPLKN